MKLHKKTYAEKKLYAINTDEIIIQQANELILSLKKELLQIKEINSAILFGSFARKDYSLRHSDIDIMIFLENEKKNALLEEKIRKKIISLNLGNKISVHTIFQYKNVAEEDRSLMLTIAKEGQVIFARKSIVISANVLGLRPHILLRFDTTGLAPVVKNKLQRFLYGYKMKGKQYRGIIDEKKVFSAGQGAIIVPEGMQQKILLFAENIGVKTIQKGKFYQ